MDQYYTSGQVAKLLRISISTLKRWLAQPDLKLEEHRNVNGWRLFSNNDVEQLREFKKDLRKSGRRFNETTLLPIIRRETTTTLEAN